MRTYLKASAHPFYGSVVSLFMLLLYEVFLILDPTNEGQIRNAPEAWVRTMLHFTGISTHTISFMLITVSFMAIAFFYRSEVGVKSSVFAGILFESIAWAIATAVFLQALMAQIFLAAPMVGGVLGQFGLAIGAGLFEELFFRVFLTGILIVFFRQALRQKHLALIVAVLVSSFAFSSVHYMGNLADNFEIYSFSFRFFAGLWFTTLFALRGFAVVALAHAFYDILVILL